MAESSGSRLIVEVHDYRRRVLAQATVLLAPGERDVRRGRRLEFDTARNAFVSEQIDLGRYRLRVEAKGLEAEERSVEIGKEPTTELFILGRTKMLSYRRGRVRVPFEPRIDILGVSLAPRLRDEAAAALVTYFKELELQPVPVADSIETDLVRVLRLPEGIGVEERRRIQRRLSENPSIQRVGAFVELDDRSASFLTDEIVVQFREEQAEVSAEALAKLHGLRVLRWLPYAPGTAVFQLAECAGYEVLDLCALVEREDAVVSAEPNLVTTAVDDFTPNDFLFGSQPHHTIIDTPGAWEISLGDHEVIIAVVDSGCDIDHPDFTTALAAGWAKIYQPFDFVAMDTDPTAGAHGTKSSGIAAALADNGEGIAGVAPECRLMPIRRPSGGTDTDYADMYVWIAGLNPNSTTPGFPAQINRGADVISNSFGLYQNSLPNVMKSALDTVTNSGRGGNGCTIVFSVGNQNQDFTVTTGPVAGARQWAAYNRTIAVASSAISPPDASEVKVSTSSFGPAVDVCAPGGGPGGGAETRTLSTDNVGSGDTAGSATATSNDYDDFGQTSCACPQVAGVAGLMLSSNPYLAWTDVKDILRGTAVKIDFTNTSAVGQWVDNDGDGIKEYSQWYGFGRIDARGAVQEASLLHAAQLLLLAG